MNASKYSVTTHLMRLQLFLFIAFLLPQVFWGKSTSTFQNDDKFTVVLDAGHGGHDPGNLGNGYLEKDIALKIVLKVGAILEKNKDINVIYTRKDDTFVDLYVRGQIANKANADVFVSVHCDSHNSNANGAGTFVLGLHANKQNFEVAKKENSVIYLEDNYQNRYADYDINSPESVIGLTIMQEEFLDNSIALAKAMQDNFSGKLKRNDRKVKQAGFIVLHQTFMPSVLVETGFLTNKQEGAYLNSKNGQTEMGTAIAEAILAYKNNAQANMADYAENVVAAPEPKTRQPEKVVEQPKQRKAEKEVLPKEGSKKEENLVVANENNSSSVAKKEKEASQIIREAQQNATNSEKRPLETDKTGVASSTNEEKTSEEIIVYKVQIMASAKNLPLRPESFNGLSQVAKEPYKNLFRYVYGSTRSLREAKMLKSNADLKGYTSSYIVAYRNGERIPFKESIK